MQRSINWSFRPYKPFFFDGGDIYICRIAPDRNSIHFEWLDDDKLTYTLSYKKRDDENYTVIESITGNEYDIKALDEDVDYEFFLTSGDKKSRIRLARTGKPLGTVINYLHPDDKVYSFSGQYLCSPSLVRLPDGALLASMDLFDYGAPQNLTLVFRSEDDGKTWHYQNELFPCYWGAMFIHKGELYMLSVSTEYGDLLIGKSTDGGKTYGAPTVIMRGGCSPKCDGCHRTPQNIFYNKDNNRLYTSCEWGSWASGYHASGVLSIDADADLLDANNWAYTPPIMFDPNWEGIEHVPSTGCIEGTVTKSPEGKLYNILRYDMGKTVERYGKALVYEIDENDPNAPQKYSHPMAFDGNHSKFIILRDEKSGYYYSVMTRLTSKEHPFERRLLSLVRSKDLVSWELVLDLLDRRDEPEKEVGFQYVSFIMEENDLIFQCRTSINKAHNFHDANYSTFHRIKNFRTNPELV